VRLFEKFAVLSARPTAGESSTGLGLSIVKRLAEAMKGKVGCQSALGPGATFVFTLPAVSIADLPGRQNETAAAIFPPSAEIHTHASGA